MQLGVHGDECRRPNKLLETRATPRPGAFPTASEDDALPLGDELSDEEGGSKEEEDNPSEAGPIEDEDPEEDPNKREPMEEEDPEEDPSKEEPMEEEDLEEGPEEDFEVSEG